MRMGNAPLIHLLANGKYPLGTTLVSPRVSLEAKMLRKIAGLKFMDHDIIDEQKFLELDMEKCLLTRSVPGT
jgi:hypothetical protein